jgi:putative PEP-CTERM system TPR-repeat lipoprotein
MKNWFRQPTGEVSLHSELFETAARLATRLFPLILALLLAACGNPTSEELMHQAQGTIAEGDYRTAAIHLKNLLQQNPEHVGGLLLLGDIALAEGKAEIAESRYQRAFKKGADYSRVVVGLLQSRLEMGRYQAALEEADLALSKAPVEKATLLSLRGRANASLGNHVDAESDFRDAIALQPDNPDAYLYMAEMFVGMGRVAEAESEILRALEIDPAHPAPVLWNGERELSGGNEPAAEAAFREAAEIAEQRFAEHRFVEQRHYLKIWTAALYQLADLQLNQERLDEASEAVAKFALISPGNPFSRFLNARLATLNEDLDTAKDILQNLLSERKDFQPAQRLLGVIYGLEDNYALAEMYLRPYVNNHPDDEFARQMLAQVWVGQNQPEEALALLDAANGEINPEARRNLLALAGRATLESGNHELALQYFSQGAADFPSDQRFEIGQAMALLADGQLDKAIQLLESVDDESDSFRRSALLVLTYLRKGETEKALSLAESTASGNPDPVVSANLLTMVYLAARSLDQAHEQVTLALDIDEKNVYALMNLALIEQRHDRPEAAAATLERIVEIDDDNAWARTNLARLAIRRGDLDAAIKLLRPVEAHSAEAGLLMATIELDYGNRHEARNILDRVIRLEPSDAGGYALTAVIDLQEGKFFSAVRNLETATRIEPGSFLFQLNLILAYLAIGDQEGARTAISAARNIDLNSPKLAVMEITLFTRDGDYPRAEQLLKKLEKNAFDPALRLTLLAELREAQMRHVEATEAYSAAYAERPGQRLVLRILRAGWAAGLDEPPEPAHDWLDLNPDDAAVLRALAAWQLGRGNLAHAQRHFEHVLKLDDRDPIVLNDLAWIYQQTSDERALRTAERAYALLPENAAIADTLGWIQLEAGNVEPALELLEKAGNAAPKNPEIQYHLAMAYRESGDPDAAKRILISLIQADKNFPSRDAAENALTNL